MTMTSPEAGVFHKLRVATPLPSRTGHPVSVVFNGISANSWLSPIGINQQKENRGEQYIAQRPQSTGNIAIIRHHPKPTGLKRNEILTGRHLPVKSDRDTIFTQHGHQDNGVFQRPMPFEEDYFSPIGSYLFNQRVAKKGFKGGGFCDGPSKRPRPYTGRGAQTRTVKEQPISLELTVTSLELNKDKERYLKRVFNEQQLERQHHQSLNMDAYEDLSKTCVRRAKSAPPVSRPSGGHKAPSLYWRARSAYHRKLMTPNPDIDLDPGENTQVLRGSMLRPLMYSSSSDIQHSAGCPYKCKGCFKACLVSQDYLEKARNRRLPVRVRRDVRQRSMMKKDPRYILHQALARNQPIYKLVHGYCDEQTVKEAWDDGGTIRGNADGSLHPDQFSVVGERGFDSVPDTTDDPLSEYDTHLQDISADDEESLEHEVDELDPKSPSQLQDKTDVLPNILQHSNARGSGINKRVRSAEHHNRSGKITLAARSKSCSEAVAVTSEASNLVFKHNYKDVCKEMPSHPHNREKADANISKPQSVASKAADDVCDTVNDNTLVTSNDSVNGEKRELKREMAVDIPSEDLSDKGTASDTDCNGQEINESGGESSVGGQSGAEYTSFDSSDSQSADSEDESCESEKSDGQLVSNSGDTVTGTETLNRKPSYKATRRRKLKKVRSDKDHSNERSSSSECNSDDSKETLKDKNASGIQTTDSDSGNSESRINSRDTSDSESTSRNLSRSSKTSEEKSSQRRKKSNRKSRVKARKAVITKSKRKKKLPTELTGSEADETVGEIDNRDYKSKRESNRSESESVTARSASASSVIHSATESELQFNSDNTEVFDESSSDDKDESDSQSESDDKSTEEEQHIKRKSKGQTQKRHKTKPVKNKKQTTDKSLDCDGQREKDLTVKPCENPDSNSLSEQKTTHRVNNLKENPPNTTNRSPEGDSGDNKKKDTVDNKRGHKRDNSCDDDKKQKHRNKQNVNKDNKFKCKKKGSKKVKQVQKEDTCCNSDDTDGDDDEEEEVEEGVKKEEVSSNSDEEESDGEDVESKDSQKKRKTNTNKKVHIKIKPQKQLKSKKHQKQNGANVEVKLRKVKRKSNGERDKSAFEDECVMRSEEQTCSEDGLSGDEGKTSQNHRNHPLSDENQSQDDMGQSDDKEADSDNEQSDDGVDSDKDDSEIQTRSKDGESECGQASDTDKSGQRSEEDVQDSQSEDDEESEDEENESDDETDDD